MLAIPKRFHTIRSREGSLVGFQDKGRSYIVGFANMVHARGVCASLRVNPNIMMQRHYIEEITSELNKGLRERDAELPQVPEVTIDMSAQVRIPKAHANAPKAPYSISTISSEEFLVWPFTRNIGVVIPYEVYTEGTDFTVYLSQVIDPVDDTNRFVRSLLK